MSKVKGKKIYLPEPLYSRLEKIAGETNRTVPEVVTEFMLGKNEA